MIEIKKEYGKYSLKQDGILINKYDKIEELHDHAEENNIFSDEVISTIGVFNDDTIGEAMDLTMYSIARAWGTLYHGDCIRVEIKVTYEPEDK